MPTDPTRTLSERLEAYRRCLISERGMTSYEGKLFNELALLCERFEQPPVAELLERATKADRDELACKLVAPDHEAYDYIREFADTHRERAAELRAHAHALVELAEARETIKRVEGLRDDLSAITAGCLVIPGMVASKLDAALSGEDGESEVTG